MSKYTAKDIVHGSNAVRGFDKDIYLYYVSTDSLVYEYDTETGKRYAVDFGDEHVEGLSLECLEKWFKEKMNGEKD